MLDQSWIYFTSHNQFDLNSTHITAFHSSDLNFPWLLTLILTFTSPVGLELMYLLLTDLKYYIVRSFGLLLFVQAFQDELLLFYFINPLDFFHVLYSVAVPDSALRSSHHIALQALGVCLEALHEGRVPGYP